MQTTGGEGQILELRQRQDKAQPSSRDA
jgi:hypothetical protein